MIVEKQRIRFQSGVTNWRSRRVVVDCVGERGRTDFVKEENQRIGGERNNPLKLDESPTKGEQRERKVTTARQSESEFEKEKR